MVRTVALSLLTLALTGLYVLADDGESRSVSPGASDSGTATQAPAGGSSPASEARDAGDAGQAQTPPAGNDTDEDGKKPDDADKEDQNVEDNGNGAGSGSLWQIGLMIAGMVLLFVWMSRKPKKEQEQRRQMLANLKKGDKVTSIGGIVGTVVEVRDEELMVKVDESANTRMRFAQWAIRQVGEPKDEADKERKK